MFVWKLKKNVPMNYGISVLFRAIPLLMALFCFGYGWFVTFYGTDPNRYVAGPVIFSLGMICIALFSTAATIIRQIIGTFGQVSKYVLPGIGYLSAVLTVIGGVHILHSSPDSASFVAGHVVCGVGFITACVATTATSSTRFTMITENARKSDHDVPPKAFTRTQGLMLIAVAAILSLTAWIWAFVLLAKSGAHPKFCCRTCDDRACFDLHLPDYVGCHHRPADTEHFLAGRTQDMAGIGHCHGKPLHHLGIDPDMGDCRHVARFDRLHHDRLRLGLLQYFQQGDPAVEDLAA